MMPNYQPTGLSASTGYIVSAFSSNAKGRSDRLNFHVFTGESKQPHIGGAGGDDQSGGKADKADQLLAETSESALTKSAVAGSSKKSSEVNITLKHSVSADHAAFVIVISLPSTSLAT